MKETSEVRQKKQKNANDTYGSQKKKRPKENRMKKTGNKKKRENCRHKMKSGIANTGNGVIKGKCH